MRSLTKLFRFSQTIKPAAVPCIDSTDFLARKGNYKEACKQIADSLYKYGCVLLKDPRVNQQHNKEFLDMMEQYFYKRGQNLYANQKVPEIFPELAYQVGATPEYKERARVHKSVIDSFIKGSEALTPQPPPYDAKWRYFWQISEQGLKDKFKLQNVIPKDFPEWEHRMDLWGSMMINGCMTVSQMFAIGMELPEDTFSKLLLGGHHLLAPTGSDLQRYDVGTIFAGFHYDLNFLTIHGKSRFPGLFVWLRSGERISVSVPEGHLLLQAGKQFEILTGGYVNCGYHEVIYTEEVKKRMLEAKSKGEITWRVSSTLFSHINYDAILKPLGKFETKEAKAKYPAITAYEQVQEELKAIELKQD